MEAGGERPSGDVRVPLADERGGDMRGLDRHRGPRRAERGPRLPHHLHAPGTQAAACVR
jgi:hypothetical protein